MKLLLAEEMRRIDEEAQALGLTTEILMERAGRALAEETKKFLGSAAGRRIVVLAGPGNNGGDGLVAARYLHDWGACVAVFLLRRREGDENLKLVEERGISAKVLDEEGMEGLRRELSRADAVIDAFFGTGRLRPLEGPVKDALAAAVEEKRRRGLKVVAVDLPSGLDADTGAVDPACLPADLTVTMGFPKRGLYSFPGRDYAGKVVVADLGYPEHLWRDIQIELITPEEVGGLLPLRPRDANKGTFGRVLVVAGSENYIGACYLACMGAVRAGAGLVTLACPRSLKLALASKMAEPTYIPLPESRPGIAGLQAAEILREWIPRYDALVVGCGLGQDPGTAELLRNLLSEELPPLVIDADGLNILSRSPDWPERLKAPAVLTPHPGEMSRLSGLPISEIQKERIEVAREHARKWGKVVVLKGACTVIASPDGRAKVSPVATAALATGGTGDVLAGIIGALLAQKLDPFDAASCGVYLHGRAGEILEEEMGDAGSAASDLLPLIPRVIRELKSLSGRSRHSPLEGG